MTFIAGGASSGNRPRTGPLPSQLRQTQIDIGGIDPKVPVVFQRWKQGLRDRSGDRPVPLPHQAGQVTIEDRKMPGGVQFDQERFRRSEQHVGETRTMNAHDDLRLIGGHRRLDECLRQGSSDY